MITICKVCNNHKNVNSTTEVCDTYLPISHKLTRFDQNLRAILQFPQVSDRIA